MMLDEDIKTECEIQFQEGGPKLYFVQRNKWIVKALGIKRKEAKAYIGLYIEPSEIWSRDKVMWEHRYDWKRIA